MFEVTVIWELFLSHVQFCPSVVFLVKGGRNKCNFRWKLQVNFYRSAYSIVQLLKTHLGRFSGPRSNDPVSDKAL